MTLDGVFPSTTTHSQAMAIINGRAATTRADRMTASRRKLVAERTVVVARTGIIDRTSYK